MNIHLTYQRPTTSGNLSENVAIAMTLYAYGLTDGGDSDWPAAPYANNDRPKRDHAIRWLHSMLDDDDHEPGFANMTDQELFELMAYHGQIWEPSHNVWHHSSRIEFD